jgi:hypothetical protein
MGLKHDEAKLTNFFPDMDAILIEVGDYRINVDRDEYGDVIVTLLDTVEGAEETCILGREGSSTKL